MEERKGWLMGNWKVVFSSRFFLKLSKKSSKSQFIVMRRKSTKINCDFYNAQRAIAIKKLHDCIENYIGNQQKRASIEASKWFCRNKTSCNYWQLRVNQAERLPRVECLKWEFAVITMKSHTYNNFKRWCETKSSEKVAEGKKWVEM